MLYVQQFHHDRQHNLSEYRRLRSAADQNFLLCSDQYAEKLTQPSRPTTAQASTSNTRQERTQTLFILTRIQSLVSLNNNNNNNNDLSVLNIKSTNWNPQHSRITRENKDYMTALAKGLTRDDGKQLSNDNGAVFSSRWHQNLSNSVYRPGTGRSGQRGNRPPTSAPERGKLSFSTLVEVNRPTTAPVMIEQRPRRMNLDKVKSAAPFRPPPPPPPPAPLRAPRTIDASGNFDNLTNAAFLHLTEGLKPSIFKGDSHFVHQLCSNNNDSMTDPFNTSHDSFLDISNGTLPADTTNDKQDLDETIESEPDENRVGNFGTWHRNVKSGRIEASANFPSRKTPLEDPKDIEQRIVEQEDQAIDQRERDIDQYTFELTPETAEPLLYEYKSPFTEEYDQAISFQSQLQTNNGNNEWNLKDFYRDVKTKLEEGTNTKAVFEKCLKLAKLQANTSKWEQRRRQNMNTYNRLMKSTTLDTSTSNLTTSFSSRSNNNTTNNEKELRELNELKRELRCNECKRITCLGNCAPGQDYHLYKRLVSSISSQSSSSRQPSLANGLNLRDQHRCKHGCTICSTNNSRSTADVINANAIITSLNTVSNTHTVTTNNNNNNRLRSSKTTFSYGQKSQRPTVDLRPRSMHQVTREMKMKFEQANLNPVVVVPLFEDESQSILAKGSRKRLTNGLSPGKSFRSQRRDSLTLISAPKVTS